MATPESKPQDEQGQPEAPSEKPQASGAKAAPKKKETPKVPIPFRKEPFTSFATVKLAFFQDDHAFIKKYIEYTKATAPPRGSGMPYSDPEIQARIVRVMLGRLRKDEVFKEWEEAKTKTQQGGS